MKEGAFVVGSISFVGGSRLSPLRQQLGHWIVVGSSKGACVQKKGREWGAIMQVRVQQRVVASRVEPSAMQRSA